MSHYRGTFRSFGLVLAEKGYAPTTAMLTISVMNEFALWLRATPTHGWRRATKPSEDGLRGTTTDMRAFARWMLEEGHIEALPNVPINKLAQVFVEELDAVFRTKQLSVATEIGRATGL